jgi:hypothetical protein
MFKGRKIFKLMGFLINKTPTYMGLKLLKSLLIFHFINSPFDTLEKKLGIRILGTSKNDN